MLAPLGLDAKKLDIRGLLTGGDNFPTSPDAQGPRCFLFRYDDSTRHWAARFGGLAVRRPTKVRRAAARRRHADVLVHRARRCSLMVGRGSRRTTGSTAMHCDEAAPAEDWFMDMTTPRRVRPGTAETVRPAAKSVPAAGRVSSGDGRRRCTWWHRHGGANTCPDVPDLRRPVTDAAASS